MNAPDWAERLQRLSEWQVSADGLSISRQFVFADFAQAFDQDWTVDSTDVEHQLAHVQLSGSHLDFDVVAQTCQAIHELEDGQSDGGRSEDDAEREKSQSAGRDQLRCLRSQASIDTLPAP